MSGAELKAARRAFGLNQSQMSEIVGCSRNTVSNWENKASVNVRRGNSCRMLRVLGLTVLPMYCQSMRARGDGVLLHDLQQAALDRRTVAANARAIQQAARYRQLCKATTRKGLPCRNMSEPGRRRCKFHGGMSTGPKTFEGKARIAEAQKKRWAKYRAIAKD